MPLVHAYRSCLFRNEPVAHVDAVAADTARHALRPLPRRVAQARHLERRAQVEHQTVRRLRHRLAVGRMPEVGVLAIDRVQRRAVFLRRFLAAGIGDRPQRLVQRLAILAQQGQFGDRGERLAVERIQRFDAQLGGAGRVGLTR